MLDPVATAHAAAAREGPPRDQPDGREVAILPEVRAQHPHVEPAGLEAVHAPSQHSERQVHRHRLVPVRGDEHQRARVGGVRPEERAGAGPIALGERPRVARDERLHRFLVPAGARGGVVLDVAAHGEQKAEAQRGTAEMGHGSPGRGAQA